MKSEIRKRGLQWLQILEQQWAMWSKRANIVKSVLSHLDSGYVLHNNRLPNAKHLPSSIELLMDTFKQFVIQDEQVHEKALDSIIGVIDGERQEASTSANTYQDLHPVILSLFIRLQAYPDLEAAILEATQTFYADEATRWVDKSSGQDPEESAIQPYLTHAQQRLEEETARVQWLLSAQSGKKSLLDIVRTELVKKRAEWLTAGLPALLNQDPPPVESLKLLFRHLKSVDELKILSAAFAAHIIQVGSAIVTPSSAQVITRLKKGPQTDDEKQDLRAAMSDENQIIDRLLAFKSKVDLAADVAFEGHDEFKQRRKEAFEKVVNSRTGGGKVAELCAKYLDYKLKQGNRAMTDEELQKCLDEALSLFRWTHAKDMFEEFYKRHFAKRLLLNKSASSDFEQMMLLRLKDECGPAFTQRLETMLKDIALSDDLMKAYEERQSKARDEGSDDVDSFDLNVNVLTQAHWPAYPTVTVQIPPIMAMASQRFEAFYESRNSGRKLFWNHSLGNCVLTTKFDSGKKELHVTEFQAIVLLLFNDVARKEKISYTSIAEQTGLEEKELKRTLQTLACGKPPQRVLRKEPQGREVNSDDCFYFSSGLKNDARRITVSQIQMQESAEEQEATESRVLLDRELVLQAATVRVMKAKKQLKHAELVQEVVESVKSRFQVEVNEVKKQFEILIEKEYMERVEGDRSTYRYLA